MWSSVCRSRHLRIATSTSPARTPRPHRSASHSFSNPATRPRSPPALIRDMAAFRSSRALSGSPKTTARKNPEWVWWVVRCAFSTSRCFSSGVTHTSILALLGRVPRPFLVPSSIISTPALAGLLRQRPWASQSKIPSSRRRVRPGGGWVRAVARTRTTHILPSA